jgi:cytochrome P450
MPGQSVIDLSDHRFWELPPEARDDGFAALRAEAPVSWFRQPATPIEPDPDPTDGYWAALGYEEIRTVSRTPEVFCSGRGVHLDNYPPEVLEPSQSFLAMDNPRHTVVRGLVSSGFTPHHARLLNESIERDAQRVVDDLGDESEGDFVQLVSRRLPSMTIMRMVGVPEADRDVVLDAVEASVSGGNEEYLAGRDAVKVVFAGIMFMNETANRLAQERAERPTDDLMTALVNAEVDGRRLTSTEIGAFFTLLSVAGNDTTRQTTSHAMLALTRFRDQRRILLEDFDATIDSAVEEFVRYSTPVMTFRRTATRDVELGAQQIREGDKVVLFYSSGNRDEGAFESPNTFDVRRDPNHHLGFGGGGPHYCMGAPIAKLQLKALFTKLLTAFPELEVSDPVYAPGSFINGINRMPFSTGRRAA